MRMKSSVSATNFQKMAKSEEDACLPRVGIFNRADEFIPLEFFAIDRAILSTCSHSFKPTARTNQTMEINSRHTLHRQQNRMCSDKPVDLKIKWLIHVRIIERVEIIDVQFIRTLGAIYIRFERNQPTMQLHTTHYLFDFRFRQDSSQRI